MVDGQLGKLKVGAIIQARMKSSRLPGKILMPIPFPNGKPLLWWIVNGVLKCKLIDEIILASSLNKENDLLEAFCASNSVKLFRGSETDVLSRFIQIVRQNRLDIIIRLTGDNPIIDATLLDKTILHHIESQNDYTHTSGLPLGMNFELITAKTILSLEDKILSNEDIEHVTHYVRNHSDFKKEEVRLFPNEQLGKIRLTIDYPSDFAALSMIFSLLGSGEFPDLNLIRKIKLERDWLFDINAGNRQKQQYFSIFDEIQDAIKLLQQNDLNRAVEVLTSFK
jgi:spore coat polysaccharide biosynthesis protein SpsF